MGLLRKKTVASRLAAHPLLDPLGPGSLHGNAGQNLTEVYGMDLSRVSSSLPNKTPSILRSYYLDLLQVVQPGSDKVAGVGVACMTLQRPGLGPDYEETGTAYKSIAAHLWRR